MSNAAAITTTLFAEPSLDDESEALTESRWNEVYRLCRLAEEGVSLEAFLANPWKVCVSKVRRGP